MSEPTMAGNFFLRIDEKLPPMSAALVAALDELNDRIEDATDTEMIVLHVGTASPVNSDASVTVRQVNKWERAVRRLEKADAVSVVVAEKDCSGAALEILLASDYRIATPDATFSLPVVGGAPWPGMAIHRLATQLNPTQVRRMALFGAKLTAVEAAHIGLIDVVTEDVGEALSELSELAEPLSGKEISVRRRLLLEAGATSFDESLGTHLSACDRALRLNRVPEQVVVS